MFTALFKCVCAVGPFHILICCIRQRVFLVFRRERTSVLSTQKSVSRQSSTSGHGLTFLSHRITIDIQGLPFRTLHKCSLYHAIQNKLAGLWQRVVNTVKPPANKPYFDFISSIAASKHPEERMITDIIGLAVSSSVTQAQGMPCID